MHLSNPALLLALTAAHRVAALPPIVIKGSKFFYENGTQFYMKGVAYQQDTAAAGATFDSTNSFVDPLIDEDLCERDIPLLQELRTNTIRTYAIDPTKDHSACMQMLDDAGIYVVADLGEPKTSINRDDPQWNVELFDRYKAVIDEMAKYSNVIGFFAGNEVSNNQSNTDASAYVKAAVRDSKKYISDQGYANLGVGYAANDDPDIRIEIAHYFNCGPVEDAIDFWGYNIYSWCYDSSFELSGYDDQVEFFTNYSVPIFFAEYGCRDDARGGDERTWDEATALYEDEMTGVFSGGIVYMYFQEENDYGIVSISGGEASTMKNFDALSTALADVNPSRTAMDSYDPTNTPQACPGISDTWKVAGDLPPTPDAQLCDCMLKTLECVPKSGLDPEEFGAIFGVICDPARGNLCAGIDGKADIGVYGAYSMCSATDKLAFVLNEYYVANGRDANACAFDGAGTLQQAEAAGSSCENLLASASDVNEIAATATSTVDSDDEDEPDGAARLGLGSASVGLYAAAAMVLGAGMVLL